MATESSLPPPPPSGGGAAKYVVILLILLMGGVGIWFATRSNEEPEAAPAPPPKVAQRDTSLGEEELVIPEDEEEEEDAGAPEQPEVPPKKRRTPRKKGGWSCSGELSPAAIRKVITGSYSTIRACYERRLKNANMLQGSLNLQVKVGPNGKVRATRVRGSLNDAQVRSCVQGQAKTWTFPAPSGGCVIFDAPYNFTPKP